MTWALTVCSTWLPLAAVVILAAAWLLQVGAGPRPLNTILPAAFPGPIDTDYRPLNRVLPIVQPALPPASVQTPEVRPSPASPARVGEVQPRVLVAAANHEPSRPIAASPPRLSPDATADETSYARSGHRPSRLSYPEAPPTAHLPGKVLLKATVGPEGTVEDVSAVSGDPLIAAAAASAMKRWRYEHAGSGFETEVIFNFVDRDVTTVRFLGDKDARQHH